MRQWVTIGTVVAFLLIGHAKVAPAEQFVFSTLPAQSPTQPLDDGVWAFGFSPATAVTANTLWVPIQGSDFDPFGFSIAREATFLPEDALGMVWLDSLDAGTRTLRLNLPAPVTLQANTLYYFLYANNNPFTISLFFGSSGITGPFAKGNDAMLPSPIEPWAATAAFALSFEESDPVPEPGTMLLVLGGLAGLMRKRLIGAA